MVDDWWLMVYLCNAKWATKVIAIEIEIDKVDLFLFLVVFDLAL
jgi:hypothetical protein